MKVLLANKFFFRNGGSEAVMFQERDFLHGMGCQVIDFAMEDERNFQSSYTPYFVDNLSYGEGGGGSAGKVRAAFQLIHSPQAVRNIGRLIEQTRPDIVHCHNIYHQLTPSIIGAAKRRGVPVVLTLHDYKPVCPVYTRLRDGHVCSACLSSGFLNVVKHRCAEGSMGKSLLLLAEAWIQSLLRNYERVDKFIAPSEYMRDSVTLRRFTKDQVQVIYNGIDCHAIKPAVGGLGYILYLGRLSPEKGIETLLKAHSEIADRMELVVAGTGPMEKALRARYPIARFVGHLTGKDLEEVIRLASFIVVPSEWYENCPMSVLEAMAYGKAVVASDIGGIPELVTHGETGLLFPPGDAQALEHCLIRLADAPSLRQEYGLAARRRVEEHFSLERHNRALLKLYYTLVESAPQQVALGQPVQAPNTQE